MVTPQNNSTEVFFGLSTDTKPTDVTNGSLFVEMDTARLFLFDEDTNSWLEWIPSY